MLACLVTAGVLACQIATEAQQPVGQLARDGNAYWPSASWRRADPRQVGLDGSRLGALVESLRSNVIPGLHSLIVVRHGYVAVEEYFNGSAASQVHTMQSVTKSVTSLVTGIAIAEGALTTARRIIEIMPGYDSLVRGDERKRGVTVGHIPIGEGATADVMITGSGNLNQWLFVVGRLDLVVVVTGGSNQSTPPDFMIREVLPAIVRD